MHVDPQLLMQLNRAVPRYTSYPTALQFYPVEEPLYRSHLAKAAQKPLSIYIHIPFCKTMCLFCACSVVLNRKPERQSSYVEALLKEIDLKGRDLKKSPISQLHLGGGTPTSLTLSELELLMEKLHFHFTFLPDAELSIEIDPRTVCADGGEKLALLKHLGFNRVSFGVQDLDPRVQEAVKRRQTEEMSQKTFEMAKAMGFEGINVDLIYGLPHQSVASFTRTSEVISSWKPDRIALFSYAKVPWIKSHQKAIPEETLPSTEEKFAIYANAREIFLDRGYISIGMDHFSLKEDSLSIGYEKGTLYRNFQGYSLQLADNMVGFGMSSIGFVEDAYFQNEKDLNAYQLSLEQNRLPVAHGLVLSAEDRLRRFVIQEWMCRFRVDKKECEKRFLIHFDSHFQNCPLQPLKDQGLLEETDDHLIATPLGKLLIRLIASAFDAYLIQEKRHSKLV